MLTFRVGPEEVAHRAIMGHFLFPVDGSDLVQRLNGGRQATMHTKDLHTDISVSTTQLVSTLAISSTFVLPVCVWVLYYVSIATNTNKMSIIDHAGLPGLPLPCSPFLSVTTHQAPYQLVRVGGTKIFTLVLHGNII